MLPTNRLLVGSCCNARAIRLPSMVTRTPTIVVYHPPTIVAAALYYNKVTYCRQFFVYYNQVNIIPQPS